jgi:hypothetical protein
MPIKAIITVLLMSTADRAVQQQHIYTLQNTFTSQNTVGFPVHAHLLVSAASAQQQLPGASASPG